MAGCKCGMRVCAQLTKRKMKQRLRRRDVKEREGIETRTKYIAKFDYINKSRAQRAKRNETQRVARQDGETGGKTLSVPVPLPLFRLLLHISHHVATLVRS